MHHGYSRPLEGVLTRCCRSDLSRFCDFSFRLAATAPTCRNVQLFPVSTLAFFLLRFLVAFCGRLAVIGRCQRQLDNRGCHWITQRCLLLLDFLCSLDRFCFRSRLGLLFRLSRLSSGFFRFCCLLRFFLLPLQFPAPHIGTAFANFHMNGTRGPRP